jgi:hypothetical protein
MRRTLAVLCLLALAGCAATKDAANGAVDTLTHPPQEFLEFAKQALQWILGIVINFFTDLSNPLLKLFGL